MTRLPFFLLAPLLLTACPDQSIQAINANPGATIVAPEEGEEVFEGFTTLVRGTVFDPDHQAEELLATWYLGDEEVCPALAPAWDGETTCEVAFSTEETTLRLKAVDPFDATGSASIEVTVVATDAPEATITSPEPNGVYYSDQLIVFEGTVSDGEDEATDLIASWESSLEGELEVDTEPNAEGYISGTAYLQEGEHAIELHVEDSTGKTGSDTIVIDVGPPNSDPTCEILSPESGTVGEEGETVLFEALVDDVDVDADWLTVSWESDKDGELGGSTPYSSGEVQFSYADLTVNTHTITMTVTDEVGATCTHGVVYTVGTAPEVTVTSPTSGDVVSVGDSVGFAAEISDNEDSPTDLTVEWTSSLDGTLSTAGSDSTGSVAFNSSTLSNGDHDITLTATDTDGLFASELISLTVNALPTAPTVTISPDPAYTDDDLVASASGSTDDDGDTITYSYAWYEDGTLLSSATTATLSSSLTTDGSTYRVVATPDDGTADGPTGEAEIEVSNSIPSITSVTISPSSPTVTDTLTCSYSGYGDADGDADASTYEWTVEGVTMGYTSTLAGVFVVGNIVACTVTPDDGKDTGTPVSDTETIVNTPPQVTSVSLSPSAVYTNDTLTATVTTSDDDADTVTVSYAWFVDGTLVAETGSSLSGATYFDKGQDVYVEATPNDGTEDGATVSSGTVNVLNSPPNAPSISISPSEPTADDDLLCTVDTASTDEDGDSVSYSFVWTVDGASYSGATTTVLTGDTVPSVDTGHAESWTCSVTPDDGDDSGSTASATVSITGCGNWSSSTVSLSTADTTITGTSEDEYIGSALEILEDIDGDGASELIIGARYSDLAGTNSGGAHLFLSSTLGTSSLSLSDADIVLAGEATNDAAGADLDVVGDVDGDGVADLLVSGHWNDDAGTNAGVVYLASTADLSSMTDLGDSYAIFEGESGGDNLGWHLGSAGDVDGDGQGDMLMGAFASDEGGSYSGMAYLVLSSSVSSGGVRSIGSADYTVVGEESQDFLGADVASAGDVDGDGLDDFLVAAAETNSTASNDTIGPGRVYLFLGSSLGSTSSLDPASSDALFVGSNDGDATGRSLGAGDIDGDSRSDIVLSAHHADDNGTSSGASYIFLAADLGSLGTFATSDASHVITGSGAGTEMGHNRDTTLVDMDGDGLDDLINGERYNSYTATDAGLAAIFLSPTILSAAQQDIGQADWLFQGIDAGDAAGFSSTAGDLNGDGCPDLIIGAQYADGTDSDSGEVYVIFSP